MKDVNEIKENRQKLEVILEVMFPLFQHVSFFLK